MLTILALLLLAVVWVGVAGTVSAQVAHSARVAAFDCDMRPGYCRSQSRVTGDNIAPRLFSSARREVFATDTPDLMQFSSMGKQGKIFDRPEDISLVVDLPKVDGADKGILLKLADAFRDFSMKAGPALFDLPTPDQLTRTTVTASMWKSRPNQLSSQGMPRLDFQSRIALISDGWSAVDTPDFYQRVRKGESPNQFLADVSNYFYAPAKDLLMPTLDLVGLESNTKAFRDAFHRVDHEVPYANTRINRISR
jgi:hypothetical protein